MSTDFMPFSNGTHLHLIHLHLAEVLGDDDGELGLGLDGGEARGDTSGSMGDNLPYVTLFP